MRDINLGTCATIVGTTTACTPLPPSNVEICLCHTASSGHLCFSTLLGGRGALGSGERGTWERIGSFVKSSKDLLHYSMLFLEMSQVFLTSIVESNFNRCCKFHIDPSPESLLNGQLIYGLCKSGLVDLA